MASREEQKKKAREERERKQREEAESKQKRKRRLRILTGLGVVAVAAIVAFVVMSGGSEPKGPLEVDPAKAQVTPGPWDTGTEGLEERVKAMQLPDPSDTVFHIHAQLSIYTNGKKQTIPQNIGVEQESQFLTSLHTHDAEGLVHMEAVQPYPFKLGQFFTVWNVPFSATQLGAYRPGKGLELQTWVNGKRLRTDPTQYVMKAHDKIVIGFGKPGSFPTKSNFKFDPGT